MRLSAIRVAIVTRLSSALPLAAVTFFSMVLLCATLLPAVASGAGLSFTVPVRYPTGAFPLAIASGDIDHTGHLALVTANRRGDNVTVYLGQADGRFGSRKTFRTGSSPTDVELADVNADGDLDIITANTTGSVSVLLGDGAEGFAPKADFATPPSPCGLAVADLNDDGHLDLAVVHNNESTAGLSLLYGDGRGSFGSPIVVTRPDYYREVVAADINHDTRPDLVVLLTMDMSPRLGVLLADPAGGLAPMKLYSTYLEPWWAGVGMMNDDYAEDLAVVEGLDGDGTLQVFLGDGLGSFVAVDRDGYKMQSELIGLTLADFDRDGHTDAATSMGEDVVVLRGSATGVTASRKTFSSGTRPGAILSGCFNRDDLPDLAIVDPERGTLGILLNGPRLRPVIDTVTPRRGCVGKVITIAGHHFGTTRGSATVRFGTKTALRYASWSASTIRVKVPAGVALGRVDVRVKTVAGFSLPRSFLRLR
jgi:FG-GAP-like repeat/IPT/TIG domain